MLRLCNHNHQEIVYEVRNEDFRPGESKYSYCPVCEMAKHIETLNEDVKLWRDQAFDLTKTLGNGDGNMVCVS